MLYMKDKEVLSVSVIVTTHNRPDVLKEAIESIALQSVLPAEVVVVDDGSTPRVRRQDFEDCLPPVAVRWVRNDVPKGAGAARNKGVEVSSGDVVMFLDDDDTWEVCKVENQVKCFVTNKDVGLVYTGRLIVDAKDRSTVLYRVPAVCKGTVYPGILYHNCIGVTSSVAIRRAVFEQVGGFDERQPARIDYEMWLRCARVTKVDHDNGYGLRYTISSVAGGQISHGSLERHVEAVKRILKKHAADIGAQGVIGGRKIRAEQWYYLSKIARRHSWVQALPCVLRALWAFPKIKTLAVMVPQRWVIYLRSYIRRE